jgi:hypothetical protein
MIKGKSPEEIRKLFNIVNDFTPEEEVGWLVSCIRSCRIFLFLPRFGYSNFLTHFFSRLKSRRRTNGLKTDERLVWSWSRYDMFVGKIVPPDVLVEYSACVSPIVTESKPIPHPHSIMLHATDVRSKRYQSLHTRKSARLVLDNSHSYTRSLPHVDCSIETQKDYRGLRKSHIASLGP